MQNEQDKGIEEIEQDKGIKEIAYKIYINRMQFNKPGDKQTDWETAKKIDNNPLKKLLFVGNRSLIKLRKPASKSFKSVTWDFPRWFLYSLPQLEWMKLIAVPLVLAAAGSIISSQIQREANQISALNKYFDQLERLTFDQKLLDKNPNSGAILLGRTLSSLRELDIERRRELLYFLQASGLLRSSPGEKPTISFESAIFADIDLSSTDLSNMNLEKSNLKKANLQEVNLYRASLSGATLDEANLQRADLFYANLLGAKLNGASLQGAFLSSADLSYAKLNGANLQGADLGFDSSIREEILGTKLEKAELKKADLQGARLYRVNLSGANLSGANLKEVHLESADLSGTNLEGANLEGANLKAVDLTKALNITQEQLSKALLCETKTTFLPDSDIETVVPDPNQVSNRDCNEIEKLRWKWDLPRTRHEDYSGGGPGGDR